VPQPPPPGADDRPAWLPPETPLPPGPGADSPPPAPRVELPANASPWLREAYGAPAGRRGARFQALGGVATIAVLAILAVATVMTHPQLFASPAAAPDTAATGAAVASSPPSAAPTAAPTAAPPTVVPPAVPAGWKVYTDSDWHYSIAYPPNWYRPPAPQSQLANFSNENIPSSVYVSPAGIYVVAVARSACPYTSGNSPFTVVLATAAVTVGSSTVTRYYIQLKPTSPGMLGGYNLKADVQLGATCVDLASFTTTQAASDANLATFDAMLASLRPA
jgi:hypothetical protein